MTTSKAVGETIKFKIKAKGDVTIEGVKELPQLGGSQINYTLTSQTITIRGEVTEFDCEENNLTSLNLSGCTALTELGCSFNLPNSLDLSGCTALTKLTCFFSQLSSLNVLGCTALTELNCSRTQLTSLDVSGCTALTELSCSRSWLTSLNVSGCTALTKLYCDVNQLTNLSVSGCTALTLLKCDNNKLTILDVSGCTALKHLRCNDNQLTSWDVSGCSNLTWLYCSNNQLTSLDLSKNSTLATLDCSGNNLSSLDLSNHKALTELNCSKNLLRKLEMSGCMRLFSLTCYNNQIKEREMTNLVNSLPDQRVKDSGAFRVYYDAESEGNICLAAQVATARAKGWKVQYTQDLDGRTWYDYTGRPTPLYYTVTSSSTVGGSISLTGADDLTAVPYGTELTIIATPNEGYELTALTANGTDILATKKVVIKGDTEVKATFTKKIFTVKLTKEGEGTLSATGADDLNSVAYGTELTIIATPNEGYELTALTANGTDILATKKVVIKGDTEVKATFTKKSFAVKLTKEGEGTLSATGADDLNSVAYGTELTIVATPDEGYELTTLTANGTDILATKTVVVTDNLNVKATFANKKFAVTLTSNEHGKITIAEPVDLKVVPYGTKLTVKATGKNAQCVLTALTANGEDILATQSFVVKGATEVKATFVDHTGVETTVTQQTQLYPNPATDYVIVEGVVPASEVTLHSMTGERLYAGRADSRGTLRIDLTPYADGVYLVCVADETYRVVVRH